MDIQSELLRTIELLVNQAVANLKNNDVTGIVTSIDGRIYTVKIDGAEYKCKDGVGCSPTVGSCVWCRIPNGNWNDMYIAALTNP